MLDTLRRIVQEVDSAPNLSAALDTLVTLVRDAMGVQVCSLYLLDESNNRYLLMATEGLNKAAVGQASLGITEGLVGQVGLREEPINLDDAAQHPKFHYLPETGEERYNSFLGVPIMHRRKRLGVLVVQQMARRRFDTSEEAFLVTLSAQLSGIIAHARVTGTMEPVTRRNVDTQIFTGVAGTLGVGMGQAVVLFPPADLAAVPDRTIDDITAEIALLDEALFAVRAEISRLSEKMADTLRPEERALFDVYLRMLDKEALGGEIAECIRATRQWAQGALRQVIEQHVQSFQLMEDAYLRERAADVKDLGRRVLSHLQSRGPRRDREFPDQGVLIGEEIVASDLAEVPLDKVVGIVSAEGSSNSHLAILARALGIPTVLGVTDLPVTVLEGAEVIVDAYQARLFVAPSRELRKRYRDIIREERQLVAGLEQYRDLPAETTDGQRIKLLVNTGLMADVARSRDRGAQGVGLYRSEIPFMMRERFPSEDEQRAIYRAQLQAFSPRPVTMRTLDIGSDKQLPYFPIEEDNPALGWRGIRITLDHPELFMVQVRAMLKASSGLDNLQILLPMISSVFEIEDATHLIHRAWMEVHEEGLDVKMPKLGVMVEVPAIVMQIDDVVPLVDFLSVGSNDLTQYMLAVDRNNARVADIYTPFHPGVLRALRHVVKAGQAAGKPVSICGEMAGDPGAALLLLAMGFDSLSMSASSLLKIKKTIRTVSLKEAQALLDEVMTIDNAALIRSIVLMELDRLGLSNLVRASR